MIVLIPIPYRNIRSCAPLFNILQLTSEPHSESAKNCIICENQGEGKARAEDERMDVDVDGKVDVDVEVVEWLLQF
jgi:hypothetical protein